MAVTALKGLSRFKAANSQSMIVVGDFNVYHKEWLCSTHTSMAGRNFVSSMVCPNLLLGPFKVTPYWI